MSDAGSSLSAAPMGSEVHALDGADTRGVEASGESSGGPRAPPGNSGCSSGLAAHADAPPGATGQQLAPAGTWRRSSAPVQLSLDGTSVSARAVEEQLRIMEEQTPPALELLIATGEVCVVPEEKLPRGAPWPAKDAPGAARGGVALAQQVPLSPREPSPEPGVDAEVETNPAVGGGGEAPAQFPPLEDRSGARILDWKRSWYEALDVDVTASRRAITERFRALARIHHPDKGGDAYQFSCLKFVADVLRNDRQRAQYDSHGRAAFADSFPAPPRGEEDQGDEEAQPEGSGEAAAVDGSDEETTENYTYRRSPVNKEIVQVPWNYNNCNLSGPPGEITEHGVGRRRGAP